MSAKGTTTTTDFINYNTAYNTGVNLMKSKKTEIFGFYIIVAINTGLRTSDLKRLTYEDIKADEIQIKEKKTNKLRCIKINEHIKNALTKLTAPRQTGLIFLSQKNTVFSTQHINRLMKKAFFTQALTNNISTHSLRKTFGRTVYERNNESEKALIVLSQAFKHSNIGLTRDYLGITQEEIDNIYLSI